MTTQSWSTVYSMVATSDLRAWGSELNTKMAAAGAVQTADTGQIDWTTITLPGNSTLIGYEVWRLPSSALYWKVTFSTGASASRVALFTLQVGTGSNGSGTLTGQLSTASGPAGTSTLPSAGAWPSYCCCTNDFFGLAFKVGGNGAAWPSIMGYTISRTTDTAGVADSVGYAVHIMPVSAGALALVQGVRTAATAQTFTATNAFCVVPGNVSVSTVGADNQVFLHAIPTPRSSFLSFVGTCVLTELSQATTFSTTLIGATAKNYISLGSGLGSGNSASAVATWGLFMRWE